MIEYTTKYDVRKTMYQKFAESVAKRGDKPCFYYYNNMTWNQVADLVDAGAAGMLANGVRKGYWVIICAPNMPQCIAAIYAVNKIGAVASMLHPLSVASEAKYAVDLVDAKFAFCFDASEKAFLPCMNLDFGEVQNRFLLPPRLLTAGSLTPCIRRKILGQDRTGRGGDPLL